MTELKKKLEEMRNGKILNKKQVEFLQKICKLLPKFELIDVDFLNNNINSSYMTFFLEKKIDNITFNLSFTYHYSKDFEFIDLVSKCFRIANICKFEVLYSSLNKFKSMKKFDDYKYWLTKD